MKLYRVSQELMAGEVPHHHLTKTDAHEDAKNFDDRPTVRIELIEIKTDAAHICALMNGDGQDGEVLKTWRLSARGALTECPNGE